MSNAGGNSYPPYGCQSFGLNPVEPVTAYGRGGAAPIAMASDGNPGNIGNSRQIKPSVMTYINPGETFPIGQGGGGGGGGIGVGLAYGGYGGHGGGAILLRCGSMRIGANLNLQSPGYYNTVINGGTGTAGGGGGGGGGGGSVVVLYRSLSGAGSVVLSASGQSGGNGGNGTRDGGDGGDGGDGVTISRRF